MTLETQPSKHVNKILAGSDTMNLQQGVQKGKKTREPPQIPPPEDDMFQLLKRIFHLSEIEAGKT